MGGALHWRFLLYKGIPQERDFGIQQKKHFSYLKDTTFTEFHHSTTTVEGIKKDRELYQAMRNWIKSWLDAAPNGRLSGSRSDR
jgi:hypothetical protein